jgi:hypothetical protein
MLEDWFGKPVTVVSYHNPDARVLTGDRAVSASLPHTHMRLFRSRIRYIPDSDMKLFRDRTRRVCGSGGRWGNGSPLPSAEFDRGLPLHILVHPEWWTEQPASAYETLLQLVDQKTEFLERSIARNCKAFPPSRSS